MTAFDPIVVCSDAMVVRVERKDARHQASTN